MTTTEESPCTVSALTREIRAALASGFSKVFLEAEIGGWRMYPSGHAYFTLKDADAQISAVMFRSSYEACLRRHPGIEVALKDGARVLVYGRVDVYPQRGNCQFVVQAARLVGEGDLMQRYLELKARLEREGLFDAARKRPLPFMPRRIGIVTSEAGAVIHDMFRVLSRRFPALEVRLYPALVQGALAPAALIAGVRYFNEQKDWRADIVVVARGGGSFEDLFCFNDEGLVRAVAASEIPVVSAVGHETDYTLCDFAADVRAGTPSIAAEIAVPRLDEIRETLRRRAESLGAALRGRYELDSQRVDSLSASLSPALRTAALRVAGEVERLSAALGGALDLGLLKAGSALSELAAKLKLLSPYGVLERGYSLTTDAEGNVVRDSDAVGKGAEIHTRLARGSLVSIVS